MLIFDKLHGSWIICLCCLIHLFVGLYVLLSGLIAMYQIHVFFALFLSLFLLHSPFLHRTGEFSLSILKGFTFALFLRLKEARRRKKRAFSWERGIAMVGYYFDTEKFGEKDAKWWRGTETLFRRKVEIRRCCDSGCWTRVARESTIRAFRDCHL